jgi:YhcH/YjgK/YiaL family protein
MLQYPKIFTGNSMAIFGNLATLKQQLPQACFQTAFDYLETISDDFLTIKPNEPLKETLSDGIFVLKQAYLTKTRENAFFESHKKYIDVQFMVKGQEFMDVCTIEDLTLLEPYHEENDFIKYTVKHKQFSSLFLKEEHLAIFFPQDAHQPCIQNGSSQLVFKAVIKIPVELL